MECVFDVLIKAALTGAAEFLLESSISIRSVCGGLSGSIMVTRGVPFHVILRFVPGELEMNDIVCAGAMSGQVLATS